MKQIKASDLIHLLNEHIEKYGDNKVFIYDGYSCCYKTFSTHHISRTSGNVFVIECEEEDED